jgi:hypothetical protein
MRQLRRDVILLMFRQFSEIVSEFPFMEFESSSFKEEKGKTGLS